MVKSFILGIIIFYRKFISPLKPKSCRFHPTCSRYAFEAIDHFGVIKGGLMSLKRILRCHPFSTGGYDPIIPDESSEFILSLKR